MFLGLNLSKFQTLFWCFHCWLWTSWLRYIAHWKHQNHVWDLCKFDKSRVFIVNVELISHIVLVFLLLTLNHVNASWPVYYKRVSNRQNQPFRGILRKRCSENMQQIYRRTAARRCAISIKLQNQLYWNCTSIWVSSLYLLHIFRTPFRKNTSGGLPLNRIVLQPISSQCSHGIPPDNAICY